MDRNLISDSSPQLPGELDPGGAAVGDSGPGEVRWGFHSLHHSSSLPAGHSTGSHSPLSSSPVPGSPCLPSQLQNQAFSFTVLCVFPTPCPPLWSGLFIKLFQGT